MRTSVLERRGDAIFLDPSILPPKISSTRQGEMAHIHETDLSAHVALSLADARVVVGKGWGERHQLSGNVIPLGYTLLYVPRTVEEVSVFVSIMQAGVDYMRSSEA